MRRKFLLEYTSDYGITHLIRTDQIKVNGIDVSDYVIRQQTKRFDDQYKADTEEIHI